MLIELKNKILNLFKDENYSNENKTKLKNELFSIKYSEKDYFEIKEFVILLAIQSSGKTKLSLYDIAAGYINKKQSLIS